MPLSPKTISTFQQEYDSVGYQKVERELNQILRLLGNLQRAQATLLSGTAGATAKKGAATAAANAQKEIKLREKQIKTAAEINRIQTEVTRTQTVQSRGTEELNRQRQRSLGIMAQEQAALKKQQELLRKDEAFRRTVRGAYTRFSPSELRDIGSNPPLSESIRAAIVNDKLTTLHKTVSEKINRSRQVLLTTDSPEHATRLKENIALREKQLRVLERGIQKNEQFIRQQERLTRSTLKTLDPIKQAVQGWGKLQQVFVRVKDALLSFLLLNAISGVVGGFFRSIVQANAQLEVLQVRLEAINAGGGGSFKDLKETILDLTIHTPFIISELAQATVTLQAFGLEARESLAPVADWAAAVGRNVEDVAVAFAKVATGSPRTALLLSTRGISKAEFDTELLKTPDRAEALANIIDRRYGELARKVSRTFEGFVSNIKDVWFQVAAAIGTDVFEKLRKDAESLFNTLKLFIPQGDKGPTGAIKAFSVALGVLYETIKLLMPVVIAFAAVWTARALVTGIGVVGVQIAKTGLLLEDLGGSISKVFHSASTQIGGIRAAMGLLTPMLTIVTSLFTGLAIGAASYASSMKSVVDGRVKVAEAFRDFQSGSAEIIRTLEDQVSALADATSGWNAFFSLFGRGTGRALQDKLEAELEVLKEQLRVNKEIYELERLRERARIEETPAFEAAEILEKFAGKEGGPEVLKRLRDEFQKLKAEKLLDGVFTLDENKAFGTLDKIFEALDAGKEKIRERVVNEALEATRGQVQALASSKALNPFRALELFDEIADRLLGKVKEGGAAGAARDYRDEIEGLIRAIRTLNDEEGLLNVQYEKNLGRLNELRKNLGLASEGYELVDEAIGKGLADKDKFELFTVLLAVMTERERRENKLIDLKRKQLEVTEDLVRAESEYSQALAEYRFERTADLSGLRERLRSELDRLSLQREITSQFLEQNKTSLANTKTEDEKIKLNTIIEQQKKRIVDIDKEILDINKRLFELPSENFYDAWHKAVLKLKHELLSFYDELADTVLFGIKDTMSGIVKDLIFGPNSDTAKQIDELNLQLAQIRAEQEQETGFLSTLRRGENESLDAYLLRTQRASELVQQQAQIRDFQTKELELLDRINQLERERNNILLDRLAALGEKVFDQVLDFGIGSILGGIFGGGSGLPEGYTPGPDVALRTGGGGVVVNISGNTIFGERDFNRMVDSAVRSNSALRSR